MRKYLFCFMLSVLAGNTIFAQSPDLSGVKKYQSGDAGKIIGEFVEFLSIPNVAADPVGQQKSADFIMGMMKKRGIQKVQLLSATTTGVPPAVYGEVTVPRAKQT